MNSVDGGAGKEAACLSLLRIIKLLSTIIFFVKVFIKEALV